MTSKAGQAYVWSKYRLRSAVEYTLSLLLILSSKELKYRHFDQIRQLGQLITFIVAVDILFSEKLVSETV